ncbi:ABC transporter substrate-binding protein [Frigidibacter sp. MR17.24]|uniref:ABC transporter substrate-binding protein n=1 Tax=Frigidibacter sp. MR17.24 TaxID=3127345 RepID=UPI003012C02A
MKTLGFARLLGTAAVLAMLPLSLSAQTLKVVMESRLSALDPIVSASHQTRDHGYLIYDTLLGLDAEQVVQPQMADWDVSEDGKVYTFTLRDGLAFSDGAPVTSADCIASIDRWSQRDTMGKALMTVTERIEAIDDKSFRVTLSTPTSIILDAFAKPSGVPLFIMPERVAKAPLSEPITDYTGSGPFVFEADRFEPGVHAFYRKNEAYVPRDEPPSWFAGGKVAKVDEIERIEMADQLTSLNALTSGEIDYLQTVPFDLMPMLEGNEDITRVTLDSIGYQIGYRLNALQPPFDNKLVREAALYAIGQADAMQAQFGDPSFYEICGAAFGCDLPYASDEMADMVVESDIDKAKALLAEAGYDGAPVMLFHVTDISAFDSVPLVMAEQLRAAGFTVEMQSMDFMTMLSRRANKGPVADGGWSIFVTSWHKTEISDPIRSYMVSASGEDGYAGWVKVPEIEELRTAFLSAASEEERLRIASRIQTLSYENGVFAPLGGYRRVTGLGKGVTGAIEAPANLFWNISKDGE